MEGTIQDLLSETKKTAAPSVITVSITNVTTTTIMDMPDLCYYSSGGGDSNMVLLAAEYLCRILKTPAEGVMGGGLVVVGGNEE